MPIAPNTRAAPPAPAPRRRGAAVPAPPAGSPAPGRLVVDGAILCREPATGADLGRVPVDGPDAVTAALAEAREAQRAWAAVSFAGRRRALRPRRCSST